MACFLAPGDGVSDDSVHPALSHLERTLAEAYRKEIDQEENVWRSLPFFAATLALELAAVFQIVTRFPPVASRAGKLSLGLLAAAGLLICAALFLLGIAIFATPFRYLSREPLLLRYTEELIKAEEESSGSEPESRVDALLELKRQLAQQYAVATDHNRRINKRRELQRARAGIAVIGSVLMILLLVAVEFAYYFPSRGETGDGHGPGRPQTTSDWPADRNPRPDNAAVGTAPHPSAPADAGGH